MLLPLLYLGMTLVLAPPPISVTASPRFGLEPLSVRVKMVIEPSADNRIACLVYDGPQYSSSCWELHADSPRTVQKTLVNLPAGLYTVTASVQRANGSLRVATTNVCSISTGLNPETCQTGEF